MENLLSACKKTCNNTDVKRNKELNCSSSASSAMRTNCTYANRFNFSLLTSSAFLILVILCLPTITSGMPNAFLCHSKVSCLHGGKLHVPDGPFAFCRCICPEGYVGLRCEFNQMFSGRSGRRIRRVNRLKRLVRIRNELEGLLSADKRRHQHINS